MNIGKAIGLLFMSASVGVLTGSVYDVTGDGSLSVGVGLFTFGLAWLLYYGEHR